MANNRIVEAYWDCPYCGHKGIGGLTKTCPNCAHPQDDGTKFYLKDKKVYVDEKKAQDYGKGADWTCSYCGSLNHHSDTVCRSCGADREEKSGDYFDNQRKKAQEEAEKAKQMASFNRPTPPPRSSSGILQLVLFGALALLVVFGLFALLRPKHHGAEIIAKAWDRTISVEAEKTLQESDWSVPEGGRITDQRQEFHHYEKVVDHYEDVEVEKSREVLDGYDQEVDYRDNGDGTFTEVVHEVPHYSTEYYTEIESVPVYREDPVYAMKYYYDIERWVPEREVVTEGTDDPPVWGDPALQAKERESGREEHYYLTIRTDKGKEYREEADLEVWERYKTGQSVEVTATSSRIKTLDGELLRW